MVAHSQHHGDLNGYGIMHGGDETPVSTIRLCGMSVTSCMTLDMYGSPHLTISYLLRNEQEDIEDKS